MYSPSGSKRFQLKRNRAYGGGGGLLGVQACVHRGSASLFALRNAAGERVTWLRTEFLNQSENFYLFIYFYFPGSDTSEHAGLEGSPAGHVIPLAPEAHRITSRYRRQRDDAALHESTTRKADKKKH